MHGETLKLAKKAVGEISKFDFRWECICPPFFSKTASSRISLHCARSRNAYTSSSIL